ncbi:MAG: sulfotransferase domain-containing protein [Thermodesulfobacteriota bacterium]
MLSAINRILRNSLPTNAPKFLIIGVQKAGTTTLFHILNNTSILKGSAEKEIHFFDRDAYYKKGIDWYLDFFKGTNGQTTFEATPSYIYSKRVPKRIYETLGPMKFIVIMRDPVKRCFSAWNMYRNFNKDKLIAKNIYEAFVKHSNVEHKEYMVDLLFTENFPSFDECINRDISMYETNSPIEEPSFVRRGLYHEQIMRYLDHFNIQDFLFIEQSELTASVEEMLSKLQSFLGLEEKVIVSDSCTRINSNKGHYEDIDSEEYSDAFLRLYDFYHEHNAKLFKLIGREYPWGADWLGSSQRQGQL